MGFGILWAIFAPLLLILVAWILVKISRLRLRIALVIVTGITLIVWLPQRIAFYKRCEELGEPTIAKRVKSDGFFLDDSTANSFGMRYLQEPGFTWLEAKSIYNPKKFTRYEKAADKIEQKEVDSLTAKYTMRSSSVDEGFWRVNEVEISDRETGEKLAWAKDAHFEGGTAKWVLGAYGSASCPNLMSESGTRAFTKKYRLAWETLR